jgi:DNA-directed RNA polymerase specialized sigma24 family protein/ribosome-associated translation inhibitor RaiA
VKQFVSFRGLDDVPHSDIEDKIGELASHHLKRYLQHFATELIRLRARVERDVQRTGNAYRVKLRLALPTTTLAVEEQAVSIAAALKTSFTELERQLERYTSHLLKLDSWRRKGRRDRLLRLKAALAMGTPEQSERFRDQVDTLLVSLRHTVRRELAYLQARGDLASDYPTLADVIDETLARAFERVREHPDTPVDEETLHRLALSVLQEEVVRRRHEEGNWVSLESSAAVALVETPDDVDEQIFEFWQPDEKLRLEDVLPDDTNDPEEAAKDQEVRLLASKLLSQLPNSWRRAVLLAQVDDLPVKSIATRLDTDEATVHRWLEHADAFLRARLEELGAAPVGEDSSLRPAGYIVSRGGGPGNAAQ